ncbi:MAG: AsnC family transcriptional regulator [Candidatus Helarchaeota archaeon]
MKVHELDSKNKKLVQLLQQNGRSSLTELGKILKMSHVSVQKRMKKLLDGKKIQICANINSQKLELTYAVILVEVESYDQLKRLMEKFSKCPRLVFFGTMTGSYNLISIIGAENPETLQSVINVCSMRSEQGLRRSDVFMIDLPLSPTFVYFPIPIKGEKELSGCGRSCQNCERHIESKCPGCPGTKWYQF